MSKAVTNSHWNAHVCVACFSLPDSGEKPHEDEFDQSEEKSGDAHAA